MFPIHEQITLQLYALIILFLLSYILGSIPFGLLVSKIANIGDIRNIGSGNIGATNVYRVGGKKLAFITLILDFSKCLIIPIFVSYWNFVYSYDLNLNIICAVCSIIGHIFPVWLNFNGGKGIACLFALGFISNIWIGVSMILTWILIFSIFKYSSVSSLITVIVFLCCYIAVFGYTSSVPVLLISTIIIFKHKENIKRIISGSEKKL